MLAAFYMNASVSKRNTIPVLDYALITANAGKLRAVTTDLDIETSAILADVDLFESFKGAVHFPHLKKAIQATKAGAVDIIIDAENMTIKQGALAIPVKLADESMINEFPIMPFNSDETATVDGAASVWFNALTDVSHAISKEEARYYLNGAYIHQRNNNLSFCATDGHRLALYETELTAYDKFKDGGAIMPTAAIKSIIRMTKKSENRLVAMFQHGAVGGLNRARVVCDGQSVTFKLIDGAFPDYERVIPKQNDNILKVRAGDLSTAIEPLRVLSDEKSAGVALNINGSIKARLNGQAYNESPVMTCPVVDHQGDEIEIGFNSNYLKDMFKAFGLSTKLNPSLSVELDSVSSPARITSDNKPSLTAVLMPLRV